MATLSELWPPAGVVVRTPRLELRWPSQDDLLALAGVAAAGIHDEAMMPFTVPWTRASAEGRARSVLTWNWGRWGAWRAQDWSWAAVTVVDGVVVGSQGMQAKAFGVTRTAETGSYIGREHQGRGIGKEMRAAMLHLLFAGLDGERALTGAFEDNAASLGVTRSLGYRPNGETIVDSEGARRRELLFAMDRSDWEQHRRDDIELVGVEAARPFFGLDGGEVEGTQESG
jgi:RimJ/RimL family protein N-acetyltransferase